jgi:hypothetical protein
VDSLEGPGERSEAFQEVDFVDDGLACRGVACEPCDVGIPRLHIRQARLDRNPQALEQLRRLPRRLHGS